MSCTEQVPLSSSPATGVAGSSQLTISIEAPGMISPPPSTLAKTTPSVRGSSMEPRSVAAVDVASVKSISLFVRLPVPVRESMVGVKSKSVSCPNPVISLLITTFGIFPIVILKRCSTIVCELPMLFNMKSSSPANAAS